MQMHKLLSNLVLTNQFDISLHLSFVLVAFGVLVFDYFVEMKEVVTIEVGQAGLQLGNTVWEQYCAEYDIDNAGKQKVANSKNGEFRVFFEEATSDQFVPRNLAIDSEPSVIEEIKTGSFATMFKNEFLLSGNEDAANIFARGYNSIGRQMIDDVNDRLRKLLDMCDNMMGFMIYHSVGGGTGSGLGSLLLEHLAVNYRKKAKIGFEVYPSSNLSTCMVEPYNATLATHWLLDHTDVSLVLDNEAIYSICLNKLHISKPDASNVNRLIAKVISSMTSSLRFKRELDADLNEYQTNLVSFPRLHFMTTAMSPLISKMDNVTTDFNDIQILTGECLNPANWLVQYTTFDPLEDKYMAISLYYRGNVQSKEANHTVQWLKDQNKVVLTEFPVTGFKIGLDEISAAILETDDIAAFNKNVVMISNNTAIPRMFNKRVIQNFDVLYSQQAFIHWYTREEMEEGELTEAREDLAFLEKDYKDVLIERLTDDYTDDINTTDEGYF
ncbi:tubulin alpha-3 chain [Reticulomyxa filosa]|uniref:Tubulin alpha chain n=1 Tax=Reticulomyxa filosa TaxID=46433 RepID=X6MVL2_RETFI|nr:tubulin alpha-3 chain [Reticulomyxa filosa]|eukprot:ETO17487.1 tubulin alpha-3 chain [Reticulomyxa filosa]